jgi:predicted dehydrogenase
MFEVFGNAQFGYQVATQAVFEKGVVNIGEDGGPYIRSAGRWGGEVTRSYIDRFQNAYDAEVQIWVDAASQGEIGGPTAWDGYATAACCEAGLAAQKSGPEGRSFIAATALRLSLNDNHHCVNGAPFARIGHDHLMNSLKE